MKNQTAACCSNRKRKIPAMLFSAPAHALVDKNNMLQKLEADKESAEKITKLMETFAGSIAHELRTPLSAISLHADILQQYYQKLFSHMPIEKLKIAEEAISIIKKTVYNANFLIQHLLLQIGSIAKGEVHEDNFERHSITKNIEEVIATFPFQFNESELVKFENRKDFKYVGNFLLTNHLLFNLIKNALRAIKNAGKGKIAIQLGEQKRFNTLIFTDTSSGIAKKFLPKVFEVFETSDKNTGTGIGLAFCKMVMQSYGGDIVCNSEKGKYTEFVLSFPKR